MGRPAKQHPPAPKATSKRLTLSLTGRDGRDDRPSEQPQDGRPCDLEAQVEGRAAAEPLSGLVSPPAPVPSLPPYRRYRPNRTMLLATGRNVVAGERHDHRLYGLPSGRMVTVHTIMEMEICRSL